MREVDGSHLKPSAREVQRVPARAAAQVYQCAGHGKSLVENSLIRPEKCVAGKVGIFIRGQPRRVRVVP